MTQNSPRPRRWTLPGVMGLLMLVYGGTINVLSISSLLEGDVDGVESFLIGTFIVALGALSDRDRHRDYIAEARRDEEHGVGEANDE